MHKLIETRSLLLFDKDDPKKFTGFKLGSGYLHSRYVSFNATKLLHANFE